MAGTENTGYFSMSKAMVPEYDEWEESGTGGMVFETAVLELVSVVTCTPHVPAVSDSEILGIVPNMTSCMSSAARRVSREFRLG